MAPTSFTLGWCSVIRPFSKNCSYQPAFFIFPRCVTVGSWREEALSRWAVLSLPLLHCDYIHRIAKIRAGSPLTKLVHFKTKPHTEENISWMKALGKYNSYPAVTAQKLLLSLHKSGLPSAVPWGSCLGGRSTEQQVLCDISPGTEPESVCGSQTLEQMVTDRGANAASAVSETESSFF